MTNRLSREFWRVSNGQALGTKLVTDPKMARLNSAETAEILDLLAPLNGKRVLELGGGVGRFTGPIAQKAAHVTVLDISADALAQNRQRNAGFKNIEYIAADITRHELGTAQYDLVFANWLLMYFDESDIKQLIRRVDRALRKGGTALFRESCRHNYKGIPTWRHILSVEFLKDILPGIKYPIYSGWHLKLDSFRQLLRFILGSPNMLEYRESDRYDGWFKETFVVRRFGCMQTYKEMYNNDQQCFWLLNKRHDP